MYGTTGGATIEQAGTGLLKFTGFVHNEYVAGVKILTLQGSGTGEISGVIEEIEPGPISIAKTNGGTWSLTGLNTYTGTTLVYQGTLAFNTIKNVSGGASSLGAPTTVAAGKIELQGFNPKLRYIGTGNVTDRVIYLNAGAGKVFVVDQAGASGTLEFTSTPTGLAGAKTLILRGATAGLGLWSGIIVNTGGSALSIQKDESGTWTLSAVNTYTGATTINAGNLSVTGSLHASSNVSISSGATLIGTGTINGAVTVSNGGIVAPGVSSEATLNTGAMVINSTSVLNYGLGTVSDKIAVTGALTLDGTINDPSAVLKGVSSHCDTVA